MVVTVSGGMAEKLWLVCGVLFAGYCIFEYVFQLKTIYDQSVQGVVAAALIGFGGFLASYEKAVFVFDRGRREVSWKRALIWKRSSGRFSFDEIAAVGLENAVASTQTNPSRRLVIRTRTDVIPLSRAYAPGMTQELNFLQQKIEQFLKK